MQSIYIAEYNRKLLLTIIEKNSETDKNIGFWMFLIIIKKRTGLTQAVLS